MWTIPNQSSLPLAWKSFTEHDRLLPSSNRDRLVDVCEELVCVLSVRRPVSTEAHELTLVVLPLQQDDGPAATTQDAARRPLLGTRGEAGARPAEDSG
jgi:hypothetical protein